MWISRLRPPPRRQRRCVARFVGRIRFGPCCRFTKARNALIPSRPSRVQILDAKGVAVRDQSLPFTEKAFTNRRADCVITLPLAALPPGEYLLKLEASMDRQTAGRALRFVVE